MTVVPLPESPCVRVRMVWTNTDSSEASSRFFLSYSGAAPTAANCSTLATDVATAWNTNLAPNTGSDWTLTEVDVLDLATDSGNSGVAAVSHEGGAGGTQLPSQVAVNVEFDIARRYRGGKPRIYFPAPETSDLQTMASWTAAFVTGMNTAVTAFFAAVEASSVGSMGSLAHVNLSYYQGFTNVTNSSGRTRAAPKYRTAAKVDTVTGYATKVLLGSQRRRRASTTP